MARRPRSWGCINSIRQHAILSDDPDLLLRFRGLRRPELRDTQLDSRAGDRVQHGIFA